MFTISWALSQHLIKDNISCSIWLKQKHLTFLSLSLLLYSAHWGTLIFKIFCTFFLSLNYWKLFDYLLLCAKKQSLLLDFVNTFESWETIYFTNYLECICIIFRICDYRSYSQHVPGKSTNLIPARYTIITHRPKKAAGQSQRSWRNWRRKFEPRNLRPRELSFLHLCLAFSVLAICLSSSIELKFISNK